MSEVQVPRQSLVHLERALDQVQRNQVVLDGVVKQVAVTQDLTRSELTDLRTQFQAFLRHNELARNLQLAQTQVIAVRQELETNFGHYGDIRRQTTGMLQAMDSGVVTEAVIQQVSEESMLAAPRYWLAPALVALASWIRDDRPIAERALVEALRRDDDKTALFFALVLRRQGRSEATARWLQQYVARQDPGRLSREFTVVLDAAASGALGMQARPLIMGEIGSWYRRLTADPPTVDAQVARWRQLIDGMRAPVSDRYTALKAISPTWPALKDLYEGATVHARALDSLRALFAGPVEYPDDLRARVDDILTNLVTRYDEAEAPLQRKLSEINAVIEHGGDRDQAAKAVAAESSAHETTVDFLTLITDAALHPDKVGASKGTRRLAVTLARDWIATADGQLEAKNVAAMPAAVALKVEGWSGTIDQSSTENGLIGSLTRYLDGKTQAEVAAVRMSSGGIVAAFVAGVALLACVGTLLGGSSGGAVFFLLVALVCAAMAANDARRLPQRRQAAQRAGDARRQRAVVQVRGAVAEVVDWRREWARELASAGALRSYLTGLAPDAHLTSAPDEARAVLR